jgi:hypothetical protein
VLRPLVLFLALVAAVIMSAPTVASAAPPQTRSSTEECFSAYEGAQRSRRSGKLVRSKSELAVCISVCPASLQSDCKGWLTDVETNIPRLSVDAHGAGGENLMSFQVEIDGTAWTSPTDIELDPGLHVVRVSSVGRVAIERQVILSAGKNTRETFSLEPEVQAASARVATKEPASVGPWVLGGIGGAMLLAAGTLSLVGWMDYGDMKDTCSPRCPSDRIDGVRTKWTVGGVLAGAGALALAGGIVWRVIDKRSAEASTIRVGPNGFLFSRSF